MSKARKITVGAETLTVIEDGGDLKVCEQGNGDGRLFTISKSLETSLHGIATIFLRGRRRGQAEGRNQVRAQLGSIINNVEAV